MSIFHQFLLRILAPLRDYPYLCHRKQLRLSSRPSPQEYGPANKGHVFLRSQQNAARRPDHEGRAMRVRYSTTRVTKFQFMSIPIFNGFKPKQDKKRNKVIVLANQKGGVGKTTNSVLLADTLVLHHGKQLVVIDADPQHSILKKHDQDRDKWPALQPIYQVVPFDALNSESDTMDLIRAMRDKEYDFIIDTPGNLNLQGMLSLLFEADAVITPMQLEKTCINSTNSFINSIAMIAREGGKEMIPLYFLPNQFNKGWGRKDELAQRQQDLDEYANIGTVLPKIPNAPEIQRYSTLFLTDRQRAITAPAFDSLIKQIYQ